MIEVALVEDNKDIREGLQILIDNSEGFQCRESYGNAELALHYIPVTKPQVVVMDINLPGLNGIECIKQLIPKIPDTLFIMSTIYEDDHSIFESLKAGAKGYLLKKMEASKIIDAIKEVYEGGSPMSMEIARRVISSFQQKNEIDSSALLTPKEKEILKALSKGLRYKEIAPLLQIGVETVRTHARNIYDKLEVQSRTEALNKIYGKH